MLIKKIDHIVITTEDPKNCVAFYEKLGFQALDGGNRYELYAGDFKINVHRKGQELLPHAEYVQTGSGDLCFELSGNIEEAKRELEECQVEIISGIVERTGGRGAMRSIYLRDPDGNLVELSSYETLV